MGELRGTHVPVLLERCLELLAPALGRGGRTVLRRRDARPGRARRGGARGASGDGPDRAGPGHRGARPRAGPAGPVRRPGAPGARRLRRVAGGAGPAGLSGRSTASCSTWVSRRCSWTRPTAGSRTPRTRRWTCGWTRRRGVTAEEVVNTYAHRTWPGCCGSTARRSSPVGSPRRSSGSGSGPGSPRPRWLAELVRDSIPAPARRTGGHPAKRTFQALRIEVNRELAALETALPAALDALHRAVAWWCCPTTRWRTGSPSGARRTGSAARARSTSRSSCPGTGPTFRLLSRGAELPGEAEVAANPRAASVRLRAAERLDPERRQSRGGPTANGLADG